MNNSSNKMIAGRLIPAIISVVLLTVLDQFTKLYIVSTMELYDSIPVIKDVLEIHYIRNAGAAWGIFQNKQLMFYIETIIILLFAFFAYYRCLAKNKYKDIRFLIILISSGAIGNFIDRVRLKYVIDFIYFKLINFPVFNVADCYVTIGVFVLMFLLIFKYKETEISDIIKKDSF